ncbi:MAG: O-succinylhomoserine sulfhydrylase, partial [Leifsonia xyli]
KHIDGQGRTLGGMVLGSEKFVMDHLHTFLRQTGPSLSPFNAWTLAKGLETLSLRVEKMQANAAAIADFLAAHPKITRLSYCGRPDHPQAALVKKQMAGGGTLVAFRVDGGKAEAFRLGNALEVIKISNNLGDAKSILTHPATTDAALKAV